jgi:hypothetical protein
VLDPDALTGHGVGELRNVACCPDIRVAGSKRLVDEDPVVHLEAGFPARLRGGLADDPGGDLAVMFGIDISGSLASVEGAGDPAVLWWTGAGIGIGDEVVASLPIGLVFGWQGSDEGITFMPHAGGHVALDVLSGPGDDLDLDASIDLGVDVGFRSGLMVRFGASLGGRDALAVGVRLPR